MQLFSSVFNPSRDKSRAALVFEDQVFSYERLENEVIRTETRLRKEGVRKGSKVLLSLPNCPDFLIVLFAVSRLEAIFIPLSPQLKPGEKARILDIARPDFLIAGDGDCRLLAGACVSKRPGPAYADDPGLPGLAAILFTSGTTGLPKGVMMTPDNLLSNARSVVQYLGLAENDRTLIFLPLYYSYSLSQYLTTLLAGGTVILTENLLYPVQVFDLIRRQYVTGFGGVPTSLNILGNHPAAAAGPLDSLRYILNAGGPISPALINRLRGTFPNADVINNYGCTEIGPRATYVNYSDHPEKIGSIGAPIPGVELTLVKEDGSEAEPMETGEIVLNGPSLMQGYYRNPEATAQSSSGWGFHTGDYAHADPDGFLYIEGRRDDIFKCGGEKVSAKEIEDVLMEHPAVFEAAVVSRRDEIMGFVPVAFIVLGNGSALSAMDIQAFCLDRLSRHKVPRDIKFVSALDKSPTGKIRKYRLQEVAF